MPILKKTISSVFTLIVSLSLIMGIIEGQDSNFIKCADCPSYVKKRVAVMTVMTGQLSNELNIPSEMIAIKVQDMVESLLAESKRLLPLNRSDMQDVVTEQRLSASDLFNKELAPSYRKLIPAQYLLYFTVQQIDWNEKNERLQNDKAGDYVSAAMALENEAASLLGTALNTSNAMERQSQIAQMTQDTIGQATKYSDGGSTANAIIGGVSSLINLIGTASISTKQSQAQYLLAEARNLRAKAQLSEKNISEVKILHARIMISWKAIDTATGAVMGSGFGQHEDGILQSAETTESAFHSTQVTSFTRNDALVNMILSLALRKSIPDIEKKLAKEPFRAKVVLDVTNDEDPVIINAGKNYGLSVGDTFGVRLKNSVLTDPDTGLPLTKEGEPIGVIRINKVEDKISYARILESVGQLKRGDELVWIGMYQPPGMANSMRSGPAMDQKSDTSPDSSVSSRSRADQYEKEMDEKKISDEMTQKAPPLKTIEKEVNIDSEDGRIPDVRKFLNKNKFQECGLFNNTIMVKIPSGSFMMGAPSGVLHNPDETPAHKIFLNEYWISKFEVTFEQYDRFYNDTGRQRPRDQGWGRGKRPVINVTWDDARQYCLWLSKKSGLNFSLPTEAEWERAAVNVYPRGVNKPDGQLCNFNKELGMTKPVGSYPQGASLFEVYDLAGNVAEWVADYYGPNYYERSETNDPKGPPSGFKRIVRGGGWDSSSFAIRSCNRMPVDPDTIDGGLGFRVVLHEKK